MVLYASNLIILYCLKAHFWIIYVDKKYTLKNRQKYSFITFILLTNKSYFYYLDHLSNYFGGSTLYLLKYLQSYH